jgi:hypothetical protein
LGKGWGNANCFKSKAELPFYKRLGLFIGRKEGEMKIKLLYSIILSFASIAIFSLTAWGTNAPIPVGNEFRVNTYTADPQIGRSVAIDPNGNFIITWFSQQTGPYDHPDIFAMRYDSSGNELTPPPAEQGNGIGNEFEVNTNEPNQKSYPDVAMDSDGNFIITWHSWQDGSGSGIYAQRYESNGNKLGGEFQVNTYTTENQTNPSIDMDLTGNFIITWDSYLQDGDGLSVYAQMFDSNGNKVGGEFQVNTYTTGHQERPSVAMDSNGNFVITWHDYPRYIPSVETIGQDGDSYGIFAQLYDSSGTPVGGEFQVNTYTTGAQFIPDVAMDSNGNFVIIWAGEGSSDPDGVYAQRYDNTGTPIGNQFIVNTNTTGNQTTDWGRHVAMDANGNFVITWAQAYGLDGDGAGVYAQMFDSNGNKVGGEFQVNTHTTNHQSGSSVAMNANGNFVITWNSNLQDGSASGVYAQRYYAHPAPEPSITVTSPNGGEELLAGTTHITWESTGEIENVRIEYSINNGTDWTDIAASTENDGSYTWEVPCNPSDECLIRISDVDSEASDTSDEVFSIIDDEAPYVAVIVEKNHLWPPYRKMVDVDLTFEVSDICDPEPDVSIEVTSDEPTATAPGAGGSKHAPDAEFTDDGRVLLRAERSGEGDGRVYEITVTATDESGNSASSSVSVKVNHDKKKDAIDSGQNYYATQIN